MKYLVLFCIAICNALQMPDVTSPHDHFWKEAAQVTLSSGYVERVLNVQCEMEDFHIVAPGTVVLSIIIA